MSDFKPKLAVVIPCYCTEENLSSLLKRLINALDSIEMSSQIILIDDGSPDNTWLMMKAATKTYAERLRCIRLASNGGQHVAILAGFDQLPSSVEIVVTMDDDLQHPPETLGELVTAIESGIDLAIASFEHQKKGVWQNLGGNLVDGTLRSIYGLPKGFQLSSFRAFRRYLANQASETNTGFPYLTAELLSGTTRRQNILVAKSDRENGQSGYTFMRSVRLAMNLFFSYSKIPLYIVLALAIISIVISFGIGLWVLLTFFTSNQSPPGWASIMALVSFGNTTLLACMCIFGVYISRFHRQLSRGNKRYKISDTL